MSIAFIIDVALVYLDGIFGTYPSDEGKKNEKKGSTYIRPSIDDGFFI